MADMRLVAGVKREADALLLEYRVTNQAPRDAYLLNRVHDQAMRTSPDLIYLELDRSRRLVNAYKKIPVIPQGMRPTVPAAPYVTPLRAGTTLTETVRIPLPVREFTAYGRIPENGRLMSYRGLWFTLGFYWSVPGMRERQQQIIPGVEVVVPTPPPGVQLEFGGLTSDAISLEIPVLEGD